ncbi:MAG: hypothetical protein MJ196_12385, partial [Treponemataceae bacterium]|nr:hypothetical protein [Treponemataceae bacterium]
MTQGTKQKHNQTSIKIVPVFAQSKTGGFCVYQDMVRDKANSKSSVMLNLLAFGGYAQHLIRYQNQIPKRVRNDK